MNDETLPQDSNQIKVSANNNDKNVSNQCTSQAAENNNIDLSN